jgi:hypothetical protein
MGLEFVSSEARRPALAGPHARKTRYPREWFTGLRERFSGGFSRCSEPGAEGPRHGAAQPWLHIRWAIASMKTLPIWAGLLIW